ncbi:MAG: cytochrome c3 family protein [Desulfurobacteriaceae bacterium]
MRKTFILLVPLISGLFIYSCFKGGVLNRDLVFKNDNGNVVFSHVYHVKVKKQHCSYCHPKIFKKKFGADKFTMKDIWNGKYCGVCHNGSRAFDAKNPRNCIKCHKPKSGEKQ